MDDKASYKKSNCVSLTFIIPRGLISKLQETKISRGATEKGTYGLLTKREKKIVAAILTEQVLVNKRFIIWEKNSIFLRDTVGNPERAKKRNLPRSRNQSQYRIGFTLRAQEAGHITINNTAWNYGKLEKAKVRKVVISLYVYFVRNFL